MGDRGRMLKMAPVLKGILFLLGGIMVLFPHASHADMDTEIAHLLETIDASNCTFIRNGASHSGSEAGTHIRRKYAHIKGRIRTTEDFITYAATKSSISGRPYQVMCDGEKMNTADWLTSALRRFRQTSE